MINSTRGEVGESRRGEVIERKRGEVSEKKRGEAKRRKKDFLMVSVTIDDGSRLQDSRPAGGFSGRANS